MFDKFIIKINLDVKNEDNLLKEASKIALQSGYVTNEKKFLKSLIKREKEISTGIGKQVAFPHASGDFVKEPFIIFIRVNNPIEFRAIDKIPCKLFFVIGTPPDHEQVHLKILSRIARDLSFTNLKNEVLKLNDKNEIYKRMVRIFLPRVFVYTKDEKFKNKLNSLYKESVNLTIVLEEKDIEKHDLYMQDLNLSTENMKSNHKIHTALNKKELMWMIDSIIS